MMAVSLVIWFAHSGSSSAYLVAQVTPKLLQWGSGTQLACPAGQMGSAQSLCGPDPGGGPKLAPKASVTGPHLAMQRRAGGSPALI